MMRLLGSSVALLLVTCCYGQTQYPVKWGGGANGGGGSNSLLQGTSDTLKFVEGAICTKLGVDYDIQLIVEERDVNLRRVNDAGTTSALIDLTCKLMDAGTLFSAGEVIGRSDTCSISGLLDKDTATGQHVATLTGFDVDSPDCGSLFVDPYLYFLVSCKRNFNSDHLFDVNLVFSINPDECSLESIEDYVDVRRPADQTITPQYGVNMKFCQADTTNMADLHQQFIDDNIIDCPNTGLAFELGTTMYVQICLSTAEHYFKDGITPMGMRIKNCRFEATYDPMAGLPDTASVSDAAGCGLGASPALQWGTDEYIFKYLVDGEFAETYLRSPNCYISEVFEGTAFTALNVDDDLLMTLTCDVSYCTSSADGACFGNVVEPTSSYPTCPTARKRRSDDDESDAVDPMMPGSVSATFMLRGPSKNESQIPEAPSSGECNDIDSLHIIIMAASVLALVAVLGTLIVIQQSISLTRLKRDDTEHLTTSLPNKSFR